MSAAEKLKALVAASIPEWDEMAAIRMENVERANRADRVVSRALPQIVAVVEAAERVERLPLGGFYANPVQDAVDIVRPVLAALDEALT